MLRVAGQDIAVLPNHADASQVFNDESSYAFDPHIDNIYRGVANMSESALQILWRSPSEGFISLHPNPKQWPLVHTGHALLHKQLQSPDALPKLTETVLGFIEEHLRWGNFFSSSVLSSGTDEKVVSLHCWCRDVLVEAQSRAFFGDYLTQIEPQMTSIYDEWDINSWMITYRYPSFLTKPATRPRDRLIEAFKRYLEAPLEQRPGGVPYIDELHQECRQAGLTSEDSARIMFIILWG